MSVLVWGKIPGYPWWPGQVVAGHSTELPRCTVRFFDEEKSEIRLSRQSLKSYEEVKEQFYAEGLKKCQTALQRLKFEAAVSEADKVLGTNELADVIPADLSTRTNDLDLSSPAGCGSGKPVLKKGHSSAVLAKQTPSTSTVQCAGGSTKRMTNKNVSAETTPTTTGSLRKSGRKSQVTKTLTMSPQLCLGIETNEFSASSTTILTKLKNTPTIKYTPLKKLILHTPSSKHNVVKSCAALGKQTSGSNTSVGSKLSRRELLESLSRNKAHELSVKRSRPLKDPSKSASKSIKLVSKSTKTQLSFSETSLAAPSITPRLVGENMEVLVGERDAMDNDELVSVSMDTVGDDIETGGLALPVSSPVDQPSERHTPSDNRGTNDGNISDEELPSYDYILRGPDFDPAPGSLVWVKWRKYPPWPCVICKISTKKNTAAIKFLNSDNQQNGVRIKMGNITDYPGDSYAEYCKQANEIAFHARALNKAIQMADTYLCRKADNEPIEPFSYFFAGQAEPMSDSESSEDESVIEQEVYESPGKEFKRVSRPCFTFTEETKKQIEERERWLHKVFGVLKQEKMMDMVKTLIEDEGRLLIPITKKNSYLGPFAVSTDHLGSQLIDLFISLYSCVHKTIHMPEWCYTSLIPKAIITSIEQVDGITTAEARDKFFRDMRTEEEDLKYDQQLTYNVSLITEEDKQRYQDLTGLETQDSNEVSSS